MLDGDMLWPNNYCLGEIECALGVKMLERIDGSTPKSAPGPSVSSTRSRITPSWSSSATTPPPQLPPARGLHEKRQARRLHARHFRRKGIKCVVQYIPLDRYDFYKKLGLGEANCPNADAFFDGQISFPFQHWLSEEDFGYMLKSTREVLESLR